MIPTTTTDTNGSTPVVLVNTGNPSDRSVETWVEPSLPPRVRLFGVGIDAIRMEQAIATILEWIECPEGPFRYVVTPNVDHVVMLQQHADLRHAYADASLVLADGWPVVLASRLLGRSLPERVPGSDLVPNLFASEHPLRVFLLGAAPGVADRAAAKIRAEWPAVNVVGTYSPPVGFETNREENEHILRRVNEARPEVLVIGLGAPKQELWVHAHRHRIDAKFALCVGATIDFLGGHRQRAPLWMQRCGLEWLHRMLSEPRRLARRYAHDAWVFPKLVWREWHTSGNDHANGPPSHT